MQKKKPEQFFKYPTIFLELQVPCKPDFVLSYSRLQKAIDCIGCKPWEPKFPTNAMQLERFYYNYDPDTPQKFDDYLTPMRLYDLCRADMEGCRDRNCTQNTCRLHHSLEWNIRV